MHELVRGHMFTATDSRPIVGPARKRNGPVQARLDRVWQSVLTRERVFVRHKNNRLVGRAVRRTLAAEQC